jgi:hypothetical protein
MRKSAEHRGESFHIPQEMKPLVQDICCFRESVDSSLQRVSLAGKPGNATMCEHTRNSIEVIILIITKI